MFNKLPVYSLWQDSNTTAHFLEQYSDFVEIFLAVFKI